MNEIIFEKLRSFDLAAHQPIVKRDLELGEPLQPKVGNLVKVITGMRRSGKSYRMFQEMERLIDEGIPTSRICYFNLEDDRLAPVTPRIGDEVLEAFQTMEPEAFAKGAYLFFDEIQEMEDWGSWMRRVVDTYKVTVYVTGSSSTLLSTEIATGFRGRAIDYELLPLSFVEYLGFNGVDRAEAAGPYSTDERLRFQRMFGDYLKQGGFPAVQGLPAFEAVPLLQSYAQQVVSRDVVERYDVAKPRVASLFTQRLLSTNGRQLSLRKMVNDLRSVGIATSRELLGDLLVYLQEAYLVFTMKERKYSLAESSSTMAKVYAIDPGLAIANGRANTNDVGQRLEDAVYLELRRRAVGMRKEAITSLRTKTHGYEVDFALGDALDEKPTELIQVCESVQDASTLRRETRALWEALDEEGLDEATLVVGEGEKLDHEEAGKVIHQIPAWRWMCERRLS